jgi:2-polyprenyl-3-methyl-5-hydroxy-6-metoxy-1,4-benzoquinol methylase
MTAAVQGRPLPSGYDSNAPEIATVRIERCPVCGGAERSFFAEGYDYELQTCRNLWQFWQCRTCTAVWLDPRPAAEELSTIYPPTYYAYDMSERLSLIILKGKALLDRMKFQAILKFLAREPTSFMDVGCGDGRYLHQFAGKGLSKEKIYGVELSSPAIPKLRAAGFKIFSERVENVKDMQSSSVDLITMFHVIEHVEDPVRVLRQLANWLAPGGVLAIETPNIDSIDRKAFTNTWWGGYHIPRHWTLFNEKSLRRALTDTGLEVLGTKYQTGHSFWLYSFHHLTKFNQRLPLLSLAPLFDPMRSRLFLSAFTSFDIIRRMLGARTSAMLVLARKPESAGC